MHRRACSSAEPTSSISCVSAARAKTAGFAGPGPARLRSHGRAARHPRAHGPLARRRSPAGRSDAAPCRSRIPLHDPPRRRRRARRRRAPSYRRTRRSGQWPLLAPLSQCASTRVRLSLEEACGSVSVNSILDARARSSRWSTVGDHVQVASLIQHCARSRSWDVARSGKTDPVRRASSSASHSRHRQNFRVSA